MLTPFLCGVILTFKGGLAMKAIGIILIVLGGMGVLMSSTHPEEMRLLFAISSFIGITAGIGFLLIKRSIKKMNNEKETDR